MVRSGAALAMEGHRGDVYLFGVFEFGVGVNSEVLNESFPDQENRGDGH